MQIPQFILSRFSNFALRAPIAFKPVLRTVLRCIGLPLTARLLDYAMDFEAAYKTDCWADVARHFTCDAKYDVLNADFACTLLGSDAIVAGFKKSLDGFDRNLKRRIRVVEGTHESANQVSFVWVGRYSSNGMSPLEISARQTLSFRDEKISVLSDEFLPGYDELARSWIESNRPDLDPAYE